jgi:hypothetical protein
LGDILQLPIILIEHRVFLILLRLLSCLGHYI